jgi:prolyl-tRNA synthetase
MRMSQLFGERIRETPAEAVRVSHQYLIRGGYIRVSASGTPTLLPPGKRLVANVMAHLSGRLSQLGAQEVGLYPDTGVREDQNQTLGASEPPGSQLPRAAFSRAMEAGGRVLEQLVCSELTTYARYPRQLFGFRHDALPPTRARGGLMGCSAGTLLQGLRVDTDAGANNAAMRELLEMLRLALDALGLPEVRVSEGVSEDPGATDAWTLTFPHAMGDEQLAVCPACGYHAMLPVAGQRHQLFPEREAPIARVHTPGITDIATLSAFLGKPETALMKATIFAASGREHPVIVFVRGDLQVSQAKLSRLLSADVAPWPAAWDSGLALGSVGALDLPETVTVLFDESLRGLKHVACGANEPDWHLTGVSLPRDFPQAVYHDLSLARAGSLCPSCGAALDVQPVLVLGKGFRYGDAMLLRSGMAYTDMAGDRRLPGACGCWLGIERVAACVLEAHHDAYGPVWPAAVAPWQVQLCLLNADQAEVREAAEALYRELGAQCEVLYDDRGLTAGSQFAEADLLGAPVRVIVSRRNLEKGEAEVAARDKSFRQGVPLAEVPRVVRTLDVKPGSSPGL